MEEISNSLATTKIKKPQEASPNVSTASKSTLSTAASAPGNQPTPPGNPLSSRIINTPGVHFRVPSLKLKITFQPQTVYLLGTDHETEGPLKKELNTFVNEKKILTGFESLGYSTPPDMKLLQDLNISNNYANGLENPLINLLLTVCWSYLRLSEVIHNFEALKAHKVFDSWLEDIVSGIHDTLDQIRRNKTTKTLYKNFYQTVHNAKILNDELLELTNACYYNKKELIEIATLDLKLGDDKRKSDWFRFLQFFGRHIINKEISQFPDNLKLDTIDSLRNMFNKEKLDDDAVYLKYDLNIGWRDQFIFKNIKTMFDRAQQLNLPLAIIIGSDHIFHLNKLLQEAGIPCEIKDVSGEKYEAGELAQLRRIGGIGFPEEN